GRELPQFLRQIEPDHGPIAVRVPVHRSHQAEFRQAGEPARRDLHQGGALGRTDGSYARAEAVRPVLEPLDLGQGDAAAFATALVGHGADPAKVYREVELAPPEAQFTGGSTE